ncbi:Cna B-type domain-containing protein [Enterococcus hulanensis]|uniref:Cna B-type domain-containing protein n=1 Tax=Enterococcus hulanensis TaxID=2559929 RepID=UPI001A8E7EF1|nr:Cna B-type domain-containing protein [Enterococcus hulanensis]MBO0455660.1 Cna B-type domain-containing protein [Enterococcus hulanensis]
MKRRLSIYLSLLVILASFLTASLVAVAKTTDSTENTQQTIESSIKPEPIKSAEDVSFSSSQVETEGSSSTSQEPSASNSAEVDQKQQSTSIANQPRGPSTRKAIADIVDHISLTDSEGNPLTEVTQYTDIRVTIDFSLPNNEVSSGDTSTITLPAELMLESSITFNVTNADREIIAVAKADPNSNTVTLTYTNFVETHSNVSGKLYFSSKIDTTTVQTETTVPIYIDVEGKQIFAGDIHFENQGDDENEKFSKYSWFTNDEGTEIYNELRVNPSGNTYTDVTIEDILKTDGLSYLKETFSIKVGNWELDSNHIWKFEEEADVTSQYNIEFSENGFSIHFGNIGNKEYKISYKTQSDHEPVDGETFTNYARMTDNQVIIKEVETTRKYQSGGGEADGYNYTIKIHKENEANESLAGAVFEIIRDRTGSVVGTIETDENGLGFVNNLLKDNYTLKETKAPDGYILSNEEIKISPDDFGSDRSVLKTVINKKDEPTLEVSGTKKWEDNDNQAGKRPEKIIVNLLADGQQVASKEVSEADGWRYEFKDLPKFKKDREIVYTVTENSVANYTTKIEDFNITNTYQPGKISGTVTKQWQDNDNQAQLRPDSIKIQLYANGQTQGDPVELTEKNKWTFTWETLDLNDKAGKSIQYTIKEVAIPDGYTSSVTGENSGNLLITNTYTQKAVNKSEKTDHPANSITSKWLPKTGEEKTIWLTIIGALLICGTVGYLYLRKKVRQP